MVPASPNSLAVQSFHARSFFGGLICGAPPAVVVVVGSAPGLRAESLANWGLAASQGAHPVSRLVATMLTVTAVPIRPCRRMPTTVATDGFGP